MLAAPGITSNMLGFLLIATNGVFAGMLEDPIVLAAVGIGNVCCMIFLITMFMGLNSAQETLTSQASGNGETHLCGLYLNRGFAINVVFYVLLAVGPCFFGEEMLLAVGIDAEVSSLAWTYIRYSLPGIFFHGQFDLVKRWSAAMRNTVIQMVAQIIASLLHICLCYTFVIQNGMGVKGLGIASTISNLTKFLVLFGGCYCNSELGSAMSSIISPKTFKGWREYLALSLPSTLILGSEWWAYELMTMLAGLIGVKEVAAQTVVTTGLSIFFEVPMGMSEATASLMGNSIGAKNIELAKRFLKITAILDLSAVFCIALSLAFGRHLITAAFGLKDDVAELASQLLIVAAFGFLFDGMQGYIQGPIRAFGYQNKVSAFTVIAFYCIGVPLACALAFKYDLGVFGLQYGLISAIVLQFIYYSWILSQTDFKQVVAQAQERLEAAKDDNAEGQVELTEIESETAMDESSTD